MSKKIIGVTVGTQLPKPNFKQTDPTKGDYIKNKPDFEGLKSKVNTVSELVGDTSVADQISSAIIPINESLNSKLDKTGGTVTGDLAVDGFVRLSEKTKIYATNSSGRNDKDLIVLTDNTNFYCFGEGRLDGLISTPIDDADAANKRYVDDNILDVATRIDLLSEQVEQLFEEKANKSGLTLGVHTDGLVYLFIDGAPHGNGLDIKADVIEGDVFGYVDHNNVIVLNGALADGTYTIKYEMEDGSVINIGNLVLDANVYYTVTNTLTNCTNSNSATEAVEGESYSATITAKSGYELKSVSVTMGGQPVSVSGGTISIASVTGNIVITAVAEEIKAAYTNLADPTSADWQEGYRLSISSGSTSVLAGHTVTNYIPTKAGDVLRVKGLKIVGYLADAATENSNAAKIVMYNASKTKVGGLYGTTNSGGTTGYGRVVDVSGDITTHTILIGNDGTTQNATASCAYIRIDGELMDGYTKNEVVITINEEIM